MSIDRLQSSPANAANFPAQPSNSSIRNVRSYIETHWQDTVRFSGSNRGTLIGLPYPYTVPARNEVLEELYYWDTYFTSLGLVQTNRVDLALNNVRNLLAEMEMFGFVPNGNRTYYLSRSQPPYLAPLVGLVADAIGDDTLIREALPLLQVEYAFWTDRRLTVTGLSHHSNHATREELMEFFPTIQHRIRLPEARAEEYLDLASRVMAECETGWDFNSRFDKRCPDFCPVDLNSNLWLYETLLAKWCPATDRDLWLERADLRQKRISALCWDETNGAFFDYDYVNCQRGKIWSAATFQPLWTGLATPEQAAAVVKNALPHLEFAFGVSPTAPSTPPSPFQWDYPNLWAPLQHLVYRGLARYGYLDDARRIASKYISCVTRTFEATGDLWEKYNVCDGSHRAVSEAGYLINPVNLSEGTIEKGIEEKPPAMMGWTAGAFIDASDFLDGRSSYWLGSL